MKELNTDNEYYELGQYDNEDCKPNQDADGTTSNQNKENDEACYDKTEALNRKIIKITQIIKAKFPELSALLDEMPIAAPDNACADVCSYDLNKYYQSLQDILTKYKLEHPGR